MLLSEMSDIYREHARAANVFSRSSLKINLSQKN